MKRRSFQSEHSVLRPYLLREAAILIEKYVTLYKNLVISRAVIAYYCINQISYLDNSEPIYIKIFITL